MKDRTSTNSPTHVVGETKTLLPTRLPGRLVVEFLGSFGPDSRPLERVQVGALVSGSGTITVLTPTGTAEEPRFMVTVTGMTGESAQCVVDSEHYLDLWDLLVEGAQVRVSGRVRRPVVGGASLIDVLTIASADLRIAQARAVSA
ncbi:hypothetical protein ABZ605_28195 [Streptomyces sp. NPDC012765]|uniref:OB-fold nucleic acid binding domain-containing protein n=1 Tax=Streptomyces sp. NPDC012765 TaxID=3155249 RepID=UPI0033DBE398